MPAPADIICMRMISGSLEAAGIVASEGIA